MESAGSAIIRGNHNEMFPPKKQVVFLDKEKKILQQLRINNICCIQRDDGK